MDQQKAAIITIGDELLIGQVIDTNSVWLAQQLSKIGVALNKRIAIADDEQAITSTITDLIGKVDYIFVTGGLGSTNDDITKPVLCKLFKSKLVLNEDLLQHINDMYSKRGRTAPDVVLKQAEQPHNATLLWNRLGIAPGMWFEQAGTTVIVTPGVPFEMKCIFLDAALPLIKERLPTYHIIHRTILVAGMGESIIAQKLEAIEQALPSYLSLAYLPTPGIVKLRLTAQGSEEQLITNQVAYFEECIKKIIGKYIVTVGDVSMEEYIAQLFKQHNLTLGLAESCTGGGIANKITNLAGSSKFLKGCIVSYANEVKESMLLVPSTVLLSVGAVSEATVIQMAEQTAKLLNVDVSLSISGILGPDGATAEKAVGMVWMAVHAFGKTHSQCFHFIYDRLQNKESAFNAAFNFIRLVVENHLENLQ
jgi:nicotinamide-nucleotide amidase